MPNKKLYKVKAPMGNIIVPKEKMTEVELRNFFPQIVQDPAVADIWQQKAAEDPIEELVELLQRANFEVEVIEK